MLDVDPESTSYGKIVGWTDLPTRATSCTTSAGTPAAARCARGPRHRRACSAATCCCPGCAAPTSTYTTPNQTPAPKLVKTISAEELADKAGYSRPHTLHCGPDGIFLSCLGGANCDEGPGGIALLDHDTFDVLRAWETDRGPQYLAYDAWWHLNQNTLITSEWGTPSMIEDGVNPELLLGNKYGHALHFWDLAAGKHLQTVDLGEQHQMVLELRPSHDPEQT